MSKRSSRKDRRRHQDKRKVACGHGAACKNCGAPMIKWKHDLYWRPARGKGLYVWWYECGNPGCNTQQVMPPEAYMSAKAAAEYFKRVY